MAGEKSELLTLEEAASVAGVSVQTFRLYVASGNAKPEKGTGDSAVFSRVAAERIGALQREAVEQARHLAVEKMSAELVIVRESLLDQEELRETLKSLEKALADQSRIAGESIDSLRAEAIERAKVVESLGNELQDARRQLRDLRDELANAVKASRSTAEELGAQKRAALEQAQAIEVLRAEQSESRQRINHLLDRLADAFFQVRSEPTAHAPATAAVEAQPKTSPKPAARKAEAEVKDGRPEPKEEPIPTSVPPAKVGVIREIEFNYLMERMGYRRLDSYTPEELEDDGLVKVPDDDVIRKFLSVYELGCDVDEVEISVITRGKWQMMQYQRAAKKNGKRAWIGGR